MNVGLVGPHRVLKRAEHGRHRGEVEDRACPWADGPGGDRLIAQIADHRVNSRLSRLAQVCHGDLGAGLEQCPDEPLPDEPGTTGHQHPGTLFRRHMFSVRGTTCQLCFTRFYRDPAISVAWSGEATRVVALTLRA